MSQTSPVNATESNWVQQSAPWLYSFWKFSRPHTIVGTTLSVVGLYLIAFATDAESLNWSQLAIPAGALVACLCGNVYIVGLNQLKDIEIDRINKPHLPVAAGEFSYAQGKAIVSTAGILAILLSALQGWWLFATVGISVMIGTAYSLPPIRLKRFPFWASLCIFTVRGAIVNLGLFGHYRSQLSDRAVPLSLNAITPEVWTLTLFIIGFTFAIAIFKDIPDLEGDRQYNISTFTIRLGAGAVFNLARWVLTVCYAGITIAGILGLPEANPVFIAATHLGALGIFWWRSWRVDLDDNRAIARCYQFIWKLFFLEYIIFPVACLLQGWKVTGIVGWLG